MLIDQTPLAERPRERCLRIGPQALSLRECLALILGTGPKKKGCLGLANDLLGPDDSRASLPEAELERQFFLTMETPAANAFLQNIAGLGESQRAKLLAAFELGRRYTAFRSAQKRTQPSRLSHPTLALAALALIPDSLRSEPTEWFGFIPLYRSGKLGNLCLTEKGGRSHVNVDPAELFTQILSLRPAGLFLAHNHPSGDTAVSRPDAALTEKVASLLSEFGLELLGHWIVAPEGERFFVHASHPQARKYAHG